MADLSVKNILSIFVILAIGGSFVSVIGSIVFEAGLFHWANGSYASTINASALGSSAAAWAIYGLLTLFFVIILIMAAVKRIKA